MKMGYIAQLWKQFNVSILYLFLFAVCSFTDSPLLVYVKFLTPDSAFSVCAHPFFLFYRGG